MSSELDEKLNREIAEEREDRLQPHIVEDWICKACKSQGFGTKEVDDDGFEVIICECGHEEVVVDEAREVKAELERKYGESND